MSLAVQELWIYDVFYAYVDKVRGERTFLLINSEVSLTAKFS